MKVVRRLFALLGIAIVTLTPLFGTPGSPAPQVTRGSLDLGRWDPREHPLIPLKGGWRVSHKKLPGGEAFIQVPVRNKILDNGHAHYRLRITLPEDTPALGLKINPIYTAARLTANGTLLAEWGVPGSTAETTTPQWYPAVIPLPPERSGDLLLVIETANFHLAQGGLPAPPVLGDLKVLRNRHLLQGLAETAIFGGVLMIGIYHLLLFSKREHNRKLVRTLGIASFFFAFRMLFTGSIYINQFFPDSLWTPFLRFEYIAFCISASMLILFLHYLFETSLTRKAAYGYLAFSLLYSVIILFAPPLLFSGLLPLYQIGFSTMMISAALYSALQIRKNPERGSPLFIGFLALVITTINDVLIYNHTLIPYQLSPFGALIFLMMEALLLTRMYNQRFTEVENLSLELVKTNKELWESQKEVEKKNQELRQQAQIDPLTEYPNRMALFDRLQDEILRAGRSESLIGVMFVDIDNFKSINDNLGPETGDELLIAFAHRLTESVRRSDAVFRQGGDQFAVLFLDIQEQWQLETAVRKVLDRMTPPFSLKSSDYKIHVSAGISIYPFDGQDPPILLKHADTAINAGKIRSRNSYRFFQSQFAQAAKTKFQLSSRFEKALEARNFHIYYQPQIDAVTGELFGLECLMRWYDDERGLVSPGQFIPIAEETGFIIPLSNWLLQEACRQGLQWLRHTGLDFCLGINISALQFSSANFISILERTTRLTGFPREKLVIELTENLIMKDDEESIGKMKQLREMGFQISIDDFGTGYSSLSYLKKFPLNHLKIDQAFIRDLEQNQFDREIVKTIIGLAEALNLDVIAEGVESEPQRDFLLQHRCRYIQGYLYAKPMPVLELEEFLSNFEFHTGKSRFTLN